LIESPLVQKWKAEAVHDVIIGLLKERFGAVSRDVTKPLRSIVDERKLDKLNRLAAKCPDLEAFRKAIVS
jgi:hypothetical protein